MPTSWRQAIGAKIVACSDCRKNRRADYNRLAWAARKTKGKSALAMANKMTDRRLRRLLAEVQGSVRVLYDKNKGLGEIPPNLKRYLDDPNTYKITQWRGRPAIVRAA